MPYDSARDLPTFVEMETQLRAARLLRWLLPREARKRLDDVRSQMNELADTVDDFYDRLGDRHWVMHDSLNVERIRAILDENRSPEDTERGLIGLYQDGDTLRWMVQTLRGLPAMRPRHHLIQQAETDYRAGRYYSTVLVLIAAMDGFVNDFQPALRRGMHARTPAEMDAWDSVVGHHKGLTSILPVFQKSFKALHEDEVHEVYRHGIMHGMVVNFDNDIVATKAWNCLFAVADWARAEVKQATPAKPEPTWREVLAMVAENGRDRAALDAFTPYRLRAGDPGFEQDDAHVACSAFLDLWARRNYGYMNDAMAGFMHEDDGTGPRKTREAFKDHPLESFEILELDVTAAAVCIVTVGLTVNGTPHERPLRWIREDDRREVSPIGRAGTWRLLTWGADYILADTD